MALNWPLVAMQPLWSTGPPPIIISNLSVSNQLVAPAKAAASSFVVPPPESFNHRRHWPRGRRKRRENIGTRAKRQLVHPGSRQSSSSYNHMGHDTANDEEANDVHASRIQFSQLNRHISPTGSAAIHLASQNYQPEYRIYNQHKNKKPVHVNINQQTVNGLLSLLLLFSISICGCLGNVFLISSLTVIESLQTRGNCYLVSVALAHLLVTLLVIPSSAVQIMAGEAISAERLCHYQWLTLEFCLIVSQLSFLLIAADNYLGYKSSEKVTTSIDSNGTPKTPPLAMPALNQYHLSVPTSAPATPTPATITSAAPGKTATIKLSDVPAPRSQSSASSRSQAVALRQLNSAAGNNNLSHENKEICPPSAPSKSLSSYQTVQPGASAQVAHSSRLSSSSSSAVAPAPAPGATFCPPESGSHRLLMSKQKRQNQQPTGAVEATKTTQPIATMAGPETTWRATANNGTGNANTIGPGQRLSSLISRLTAISSMPRAEREKSGRLSLAQQFADLEEAHLEQAKCLSYRNCCGRLKVLVWILLVWFGAFAYIMHQHRHSYGPKFCQIQPQAERHHTLVSGAAHNLNNLPQLPGDGKQAPPGARQRTGAEFAGDTTNLETPTGAPQGGGGGALARPISARGEQTRRSARSPGRQTGGDQLRWRDGISDQSSAPRAGKIEFKGGQSAASAPAGESKSKSETETRPSNPGPWMAGSASAGERRSLLLLLVLLLERRALNGSTFVQGSAPNAGDYLLMNGSWDDDLVSGSASESNKHRYNYNTDLGASSRRDGTTSANISDNDELRSLVGRSALQLLQVNAQVGAQTAEAREKFANHYPAGVSADRQAGGGSKDSTGAAAAVAAEPEAPFSLALHSDGRPDKGKGSGGNNKRKRADEQSNRLALGRALDGGPAELVLPEHNSADDIARSNGRAGRNENGAKLAVGPSPDSKTNTSRTGSVRCDSCHRNNDDKTTSTLQQNDNEQATNYGSPAADYYYQHYARIQLDRRAASFFVRRRPNMAGGGGGDNQVDSGLLKCVRSAVRELDSRFGQPGEPARLPASDFAGWDFRCAEEKMTQSMITGRFEPEPGGLVIASAPLVGSTRGGAGALGSAQIEAIRALNWSLLAAGSRVQPLLVRLILEPHLMNNNRRNEGAEKKQASSNSNNNLNSRDEMQMDARPFADGHGAGEEARGGRRRGTRSGLPAPAPGLGGELGRGLGLGGAEVNKHQASELDPARSGKNTRDSSAPLRNLLLLPPPSGRQTRRVSPPSLVNQAPTLTPAGALGAAIGGAGEAKGKNNDPVMGSTNLGQQQASKTSLVVQLVINSNQWPFWLWLFGCILVPTLASGILFARAYVKMKEFKTRPYKPMPLIGTGVSCSLLNDSAHPILMPHSPVPLIAQQQVYTFERPAAAAAAAIAASASSQDEEEEVDGGGDGSEEEAEGAAAEQVEGRAGQAEARASLPARQHRQVSQVMSAPAMAPQTVQRLQDGAGSVQFAAPHRQVAPSPATMAATSLPQADQSFSAPPSASFMQLQQQQQQHRAHDVFARRAAPDTLGQANITWPGNRLLAAEGSGGGGGGGDQVARRLSERFQPHGQPQQHFEFRRSQFHAQSFHYGSGHAHYQPVNACAWPQPQPQHRQQAQPPALLPGERDSIMSARAVIGVSPRHLSPVGAGHSLEDSPSAALARRQLLERHKSLPRSSRLLQSQQENCHQSTAAAAAAVALANVIKSIDEAPKLDRCEQSREWTVAPNGTAAAANDNEPPAPRAFLSGPLVATSPPPPPPARATRKRSAPTGRAQCKAGAITRPGQSKVVLCTYFYMTDDQLLKSNIIVFVANLTFWLPFVLLAIVTHYRDLSLQQAMATSAPASAATAATTTATTAAAAGQASGQELRDSVWWLATLNCCSCSYVYALTNKDFRDAYNKLFYYCCCKSHVTFPRKTPIFRRQLDVDSQGNLRVHIIPGLNLYSNKSCASPNLPPGAENDLASVTPTASLAPSSFAAPPNSTLDYHRHQTNG